MDGVNIGSVEYNVNRNNLLNYKNTVNLKFVYFKRTNQGHYCGKASETVSEYIELQDARTHTHLTELHNIILSSIPDVKERIAWSIPFYEKEKCSVSFVACKKHISLYVDTEVIEKFKLQLSEFEIKQNAIYFPYNKVLPTELIKDIIIQIFETE